MITKNNFILVDSQGKARRMAVGDSEGHPMPFVVRTIVEEGDTPLVRRILEMDYQLIHFSAFYKPSH